MKKNDGTINESSALKKFRKHLRRKKRLKKFGSFLCWVCLLVAVGAAIWLSCFSVTRCQDAGMSSSITEGNAVVSNRLSYLLHEPQRGEVITFKTRDSFGSRKVLQRRVIAFPGEKVSIKDGKVYINGSLCSERYVDGNTDSDIETVIVPQGTYFVLSDNRGAGPDSRDGIYVAADEIVGGVIANFYMPYSISEARDFAVNYFIDQFDKLYNNF